MRVAEPVLASWKAHLALGFRLENERTVLAERRSEGPLVVQRPFYPEGESVCQAIVVHPPGGIAGGDEVALSVVSEAGAAAVLTTPGAAKWYRSSGAWATQDLRFHADGALEWLPRETILFDGTLARLRFDVELGEAAKFIGWEVLCLGRFAHGKLGGEARLETTVSRAGNALWIERGRLNAAGPLMHSPAGLAGRSVLGTFLAAGGGALPEALVSECRAELPALAITVLPGLLVGRYLGDETEEALQAFARLWALLRPHVIGRVAVVPRIWST